MFIFISVFKLAQKVLICWQAHIFLHTSVFWSCYPYSFPPEGAARCDRGFLPRQTALLPLLLLRPLSISVWEGRQAREGEKNLVQDSHMPEQTQRPVEALISQKQDYSIRD